MGYISAKCPNCGGLLNLNDSEGLADCPYCKSQFYKEQAIINYNYSIGNIANVENMIVQDDTINQMIISADAYLNKMHDYKNAIKKYSELVDKAANRYEGWWGLVKSYTKNFQYVECGTQIFNNVFEYKNRALSVADDNVSKQIENEWNAFYNRYISYVNEMNQRINFLTFQRDQSVAPIKMQQKDVLIKIDELKKNVEKIGVRENIYNVLVNIVGWISAFLFMIILIGLKMESNSGSVDENDYIGPFIILIVLWGLFALLLFLRYISSKKMISRNDKIYWLINRNYPMLVNEIAKTTKIQNMQINDLKDKLNYGTGKY